MSTVSEEWKNMLEYARQYLNLVQESSDSIYLVETFQCIMQEQMVQCSQFSSTTLLFIYGQWACGAYVFNTQTNQNRAT